MADLARVGLLRALAAVGAFRHCKVLSRSTWATSRVNTLRAGSAPLLKSKKLRAMTSLVHAEARQGDGRPMDRLPLSQLMTHSCLGVPGEPPAAIELKHPLMHLLYWLRRPRPVKVLTHLSSVLTHCHAAARSGSCSPWPPAGARGEHTIMHHHMLFSCAPAQNRSSSTPSSLYASVIA